MSASAGPHSDPDPVFENDAPVTSSHTGDRLESVIDHLSTRLPATAPVPVNYKSAMLTGLSGTLTTIKHFYLRFTFF